MFAWQSREFRPGKPEEGNVEAMPRSLYCLTMRSETVYDGAIQTEFAGTSSLAAKQAFFKRHLPSVVTMTFYRGMLRWIY